MNPDMSRKQERIFPAVELLADVLRVKQAAYDALLRAEPGRAEYYASPQSIYPRYYTEALARLSRPDILPLTQVAEKMGLTSKALLRKAERGAVVLIDIEGQQYVPAWTLAARGRAKKLHTAIAREFAQSGKSTYFKFMDYLKFMSEESLALRVEELPARSVKDIFRAAGVKQGVCQVQLQVPMYEAVERACGNPPLMAVLAERLAAAVTRTVGMGGPDEGGLSPEFLQEFVPENIPKRTRWERAPSL